MNELPWEKRVALKRMLAAGASYRGIRAAVQCSTQTITRYARMWQFDVTCGCGQKAGHRGWCKVRLAFSPNRRGWLANYWEKRSDLELSMVVDATCQAATSLGHQLGRFVWSAPSSATLAYAICSICGAMARVSPKGSRERFSGTATRNKCFSKSQIAAMKAATQEKKQWRAGKRTLSAIRKSLRQPSSRIVVSAPPPTSCE